MSRKTRIETRFDELRRCGEKGFIAYVTAGDPGLKDTVDVVLRLEDAGVDIVELGIPFSDPLADGRVNQEAATRALDHGATLEGVLTCVRTIRRRSGIPLLFFSYLNPLLARGFDRTVEAAAAAGVDGFLVLDLPIEEARPYARSLSRHRLNNVCLVTPTSPDERIQRIVGASSGFVYCVSREGVTGMQKQLARAATELVRKTRRFTSLPVALGFGISSSDQARAAARVADAVVVGSAIVDRFASAPRTAGGRAETARWVKKLVRAVKQV
ncbi:MAG: tryptophan synthase subunit alpha [Verrucomicrobiota bacterium]